MNVALSRLTSYSCISPSRVIKSHINPIFRRLVTVAVSAATKPCGGLTIYFGFVISKNSLSPCTTTSTFKFTKGILS